ncbi:MAG: hypothetical protein HXY47_06255 [Nitrospirae bacterium]|nr:hypothetical protein [Nitrospirota bacterium]
MNKTVWAVCGVFIILIISTPLFAEEDKPGCKDHPMFTRMPNFYIENCKEKDFDQADFVSF